jgi:FecR protein.
MTDLDEFKRDRPCNRRWLLRHGALALPFILVGIPARAVERVGSVEDVKGEAFAELDAVRRTLDRAAPVFLADEVVTGAASRLGMRLGRKYDDQAWRTSAAEDRSVSCRCRRGDDAALGAVAVRSTAAQRARGVRIRSPFALIAVRGTQFFAGPSNGPFGVFVARGSVAVTSAGQQVILREGEGTDFVLARHSADAGQTMGATTDPRRARKRQLSA